MVHEGVRRVDDDVACGQDAREHVEVLAASRRGASAERGVEGADLHEDVATHGHADAGPHASRRDREERAAFAFLAQDLQALGHVARAPHAGLHVLGEATARFEPTLRLVAFLQRQGDAGGGSYVRRSREGIDHRGQPVRVDDRVVVGEDDDLATGGQHAAVAGARQAGTRGRHDGHARVVDTRELLACLAGLGGVIHDDQREAMMLLGQNRAHRSLEHVAGADRAHDDRGVDLRAGTFFPSARGRSFDCGDARRVLGVSRPLNLDEVGVTPIVAHENERAGVLRVTRNQLGDAGGAVNVPDGRCLIVDHQGLLGTHFLSFESVESFFWDALLSDVFLGVGSELTSTLGRIVVSSGDGPATTSSPGSIT